MEKIKNKKKKEKILKAFMKDIKKKLFILRQLHIVHGDIKPDNILYSPGWRRIVLIDFGLSRFIKESVDEETETHFMGSPHFSGK